MCDDGSNSLYGDDSVDLCCGGVCGSWAWFEGPVTVGFPPLSEVWLATGARGVTTMLSSGVAVAGDVYLGD